MTLPYSRSESETYKRCEREWLFRYGMPNGTPTPGFEPLEPSLPPTLGLSIHKGMEVLFRLGSDLDSAIKAALEEWDKLTNPLLPKESRGVLWFNDEQRALIEAFLRAWRVSQWDSFNNQYEVLKIEGELRAPTPRGPILQSRCDLIVKERHTGHIYIPDWKVVKDGRDWSSKWAREAQTFSQIYAVERALGEEVSGCIYWGFLKGDRRDHRQLSRLIYGYRCEVREGVFIYDTESTTKKGWAKFPVWLAEELGSSPSERLKYWINWLPEDVVSSQFVVSPPVLKDSLLVDEWIDFSSKDVIESHKRDPRLGQFRPSRSDWNCKKCSFERVCFEGREPEEGFSPRKDHHALEGGEE